MVGCFRMPDFLGKIIRENEGNCRIVRFILLFKQKEIRYIETKPEKRRGYCERKGEDSRTGGRKSASEE